ncbi:MAG: FHA domain-containing protein [Phycisphaerae bacterium]
MTSGETIADQVPCVPAGAPVVTVTICSGPGEGQSIKLRRVASLFGTKAGCKLVLRHPRIDGRHCVIVNTGVKLFLRDLDTRGKTLRNGLKVEQEIIEDADRVQLGPWELKIDLTMPRLAGASDSPVIMDLEPDPTVLAIEDPGTRKLTRLSRDVSILGRSSGCDVPIEDREVSRVHAIIFNFLNRPALLDLVSENGTWVNDKRAVFAMLQDGDVLTLGSYQLRFRCNTPKTNSGVDRNGRVLKPAPFGPPPEGTLSDFIDFSAESKLQ